MVDGDDSTSMLQARYVLKVQASNETDEHYKRVLLKTADLLEKLAYKKMDEDDA